MAWSGAALHTVPGSGGARSRALCPLCQHLLCPRAARFHGVLRRADLGAHDLARWGIALGRATGGALWAGAAATTGGVVLAAVHAAARRVTARGGGRWRLPRARIPHERWVASPLGFLHGGGTRGPAWRREQ